MNNLFSSILLAVLALAGAIASRGAETFAIIVQGNGDLRLLNVARGTNVLIRDNSGFYVGLAINSDKTSLYGVVTPSRTTISTLMRLDPQTGVPTTVGPCGVPLSALTSLADGRLFAVGYDDSLYQINPNTGTATEIGPTGLPSLVSGNFGNSLASDGTTLYYTLEISSGPFPVDPALYRLDLTTGRATWIGPTKDGIAGSAFAGPTFETGQLYGFRQNDGYTYSISLVTGAATRLNRTGVDDIYGGVGIITFVLPTVTLADATSCLGESITLAPVVTGSGPFTYQWRRNDVNVSGATNATLGPIRFSDNYAVVVCNEGGCATSRVGHVTFFQGPQILRQPPAAVTACAGTPVAIDVAVGSGPVGVLFVQWTREGQVLPASSSLILRIASVQAADAGTYRAVVSDGACVTTSAPCVLTVTGGNPLDSDLAEGNASSWCAFASDGAYVNLRNWTGTRVQAGQLSLRLYTASGGDTGVRFPCDPTAHWDLSTYEYLEFWSYAENPWPNGFQGNQPIVVLRTATGDFRYEPPAVVTTNNSWSYYRIPLAGNAFWRRTTTNYPTLGDVNQIEIHQDTWDYGFTIYYDGLRFARDRECPRLILQAPQPLGNDRYRISLSRVDGVPYYTNSPPVLDVRYSTGITAPWDSWLRAPANELRVERGKVVWDHASSDRNRFYRAADQSALRFDVPATTNLGGLGTSPGQFVYPQGMCVGVDGELHVVDNTGQRVQVFDKDTMVFKRQYANGLFFPKDVAVNASGVAYVSEYGDRIWVYAPDGSLLHNFTLRARAFPEGLFIDPTSGNLVVAESPTEESRISVWTPAGTLVRSWTPTTGTYDVWVSSAGEVFCAAWGGIYRYSSAGVLLSQFNPRHRANAICGDDAGILYVTYIDHASLDAYTLDGALQCTYEMMPCSLEEPYSGLTFGVAYSGPNQLFVTDRANHKVIRLEIVRQRCSDCGP